MTIVCVAYITIKICSVLSTSLCYSSLLVCESFPGYCSTHLYPHLIYMLEYISSLGCCSKYLQPPLTLVLGYVASLRYCSTHFHRPVSHVLGYVASLRYCSTHFHLPVVLVGCGGVGLGDLAGVTQL